MREFFEAVKCQQTHYNSLAKAEAEINASANKRDSSSLTVDVLPKNQLERVNVCHNVDKADELIKHEEQDYFQKPECKICLNSDIETVCLPCGHACSCDNCVRSLTHCPICRLFIKGTVKIAW